MLGAWNGASDGQPHAPEGVGGGGNVARDVVRGCQVRGEQRQLTTALAQPAARTAIPLFLSPRLCLRPPLVRVLVRLLLLLRLKNAA